MQPCQRGSRSEVAGQIVNVRRSVQHMNLAVRVPKIMGMRRFCKISTSGQRGAHLIHYKMCCAPDPGYLNWTSEFGNTLRTPVGGEVCPPPVFRCPSCPSEHEARDG